MNSRRQPVPTYAVEAGTHGCSLGMEQPWVSVSMYNPTNSVADNRLTFTKEKRRKYR